MFWKIYAWFYLILFSIGYVFLFAKHPLFTFFDIAFSFLAFIGLFLFAFKKKILNVLFWKIYVLTHYLWDSVANLYIAPKLFNSPIDLNTYISFLLILIEWIGLYLYAFKFLEDNNERYQSGSVKD